MTHKVGKGNISAKIVADSISNHFHRLTTFELEYHRYIHSEFMTHRQFSRNAASSRAVPVKSVIENIRNNPAIPIHWGKKQSGMQAKEECNNEIELPVAKAGNNANIFRKFSAKYVWAIVREYSILIAEAFDKAEYHKQIVNRILEPYQMIKVVVTATEFDNFFWLRDHADAQPEIRELARLMLEAYNESEPKLLMAGDWHVPYFFDGYWIGNSPSTRGYSLENAQMISSSCCAQVSYRKNDDTLEKAHDVYNRLVDSKPVHASPFEHQGTPMREPSNGDFENEPYATHMDRFGNMWSGNLQGWNQYRQMIPDNSCNDYNGIKKGY